MRCNWSTTARNISCSIACPLRAPVRARYYNRPALHTTFPPKSAPVCDRATSFRSLCVAFAPPKTQPAESHTTVPPLSHSSLTRAQISRAACHAVHISIRQYELADAYHIVNSLRYSTLRHDASSPAITKHRWIRQSLQDFEAVAIDFGRDVSPRLASHALLHGLLRIGLTKKSFKLAKLMMESGISLRSRTLEVVIRGLVPPNSSSTIGQGRLTKFMHNIESSDVLTLRPSTVQDPGARSALQLLLLARNSHNHRTDGMFATLICMCLINGEIIIASLLFGFIVKDWQLKKSLAARFNPTAPAAEVAPAEPTRKEKALRARYEHLRAESVFPRPKLMHSVLPSIDDALLSDREDEESQRSFLAALQALANLAVLLDHRQIPFPEVGPLIRSMYHCPRVEDEVWILDEKGKPKLVKAYEYFHAVLKRLIGSLPTGSRSRITALASTLHPVDHLDDILPPLDLAAYNSLLHYALRHRLSHALANTVLDHMTKERCPPLQPDIVTYNILIRSGTLLRQPGIADQAFAVLLGRQNSSFLATQPRDRTKPAHGTGPFQDNPLEPESDMELEATANPSRLSSALARLNHETVSLSLAPPTSMPLVKADLYTMSSFITHLTSTGNPHLVAEHLLHILPELQPPTDAASSPSAVSTPSLSEHRKLRLRRAASRGPYLYTSLLNALRKAGRTGLAERVWALARAAERESWELALAGGVDVEGREVKSWCLPIHAYTTMMQCYAMEGRKGLMRRRGDSAWEPREGGHPVVGWAKLERKRAGGGGGRGETQRWAMGRRMGLALYRSMKVRARRAREVSAAVRRGYVQEKKNGGRSGVETMMRIPRPDARFFNAVLSLFSRRPSMRPRRARTTRARWRRRLRLAKEWYARGGEVPRGWDPVLREVAEDMVRAGLAVPPGLRQVFVGRWEERFFGNVGKEGITRDRSPWAFPRRRRKRAFVPHAVATQKIRGLPLGRRQRTTALHEGK